MKLFNKIFLLFAASCLLFVACNDEDDFTPGDPELDGCYKVYFPQDQDVNLSLDPDEATELDVLVKRANTSGAITVPYDLIDETGVFNVGDIVFADGVDSCFVHVTFNNAEVGVSYSCSIDVSDPMYASVYSSNYPRTITVSVVRERWIQLEGYATYTDNYWFENSYQVEIMQSETVPTKFRLLKPYEEGWIAEEYCTATKPKVDNTYFVFQVMSKGSVVSGVTLTQSDLVYYEPYDTGYYHERYESNVWVYHPGDLSSTAGDEDNFIYNKVLSYQDDGTPALVQLAPRYWLDEYEGGWNRALYEDIITILFPGVELTDYSAEVKYHERDEDLMVNATVTLGKDVDTARVAFVSGSSVNSAASAIQNGTADYDVLTESGDVSFYCDEGGTFSIVVVTYDELGVVQETGSATFKLSDPYETWSAYGTGDYAYSVYFSGTGSDLTLYQSETDSERFKVENWGENGVDFVFTWDKKTNEVVVEEQTVGAKYVDEEDGNEYTVYVGDLSDYLGTGGSFYNEGTFYFMVAYYCEAGDFGFGSETFTLSSKSVDPFTLSDLLGTYSVEGYSDLGKSSNETNDWVFAASDDETAGNFMLTNYNGWKNEKMPIYGTFDTATGRISIETGSTGLLFATDSLNKCDYYFVSYDATEGNGNGVELTLQPNGTFVGPLDGDMILEVCCEQGSTIDKDEEAEIVQAFTFVYGTKTADAAAVTTTSLSASKDVKVGVKEVTRKSLVAPKTTVNRVDMTVPETTSFVKGEMKTSTVKPSKN